jgi:hypothetical protein
VWAGGASVGVVFVMPVSSGGGLAREPWIGQAPRE